MRVVILEKFPNIDVYNNSIDFWFNDSFIDSDKSRELIDIALANGKFVLLSDEEKENQ